MEESTGLNSYIQTMQKKSYVDNEYQHAEYSLDSEMPKFTWEDPYEISRIVDKSLQLANISNDRLLFLERQHAEVLTQIYMMAYREPELRDWFNEEFYSWRGSILLTKAKDGGERKLQAAVGTKYVPMGQMAGFGNKLDFDKPPEPSAWEKLMGGIFRRR